jgi:LmbE family N-acetylglucosaminyl deacetylase
VSARLAAVFAHPDDDTFGAAGIAALHADDPGFGLSVILATNGNAGQIADPSLATPETLGRVREEEDRASWRALGVEPDELTFLGYTDGGVAEAPQGELAERVAELLRAFRPDVVVTFGPDGITGHDDHVAVHHAATEAFHRLREKGGEGFHRLLWTVLPQSALQWFSDRLVERGMDPIDPTAPFQPRAVPDEAVGVDVDTSRVWTRVQAALREHRTQNDADAFPEDLAEGMLSRVSYSIGWPVREPGAPALTDVFEGLP